MIVGWTRDVQPIFIFKRSKRPLDSGGGRCAHHHFYLSEQCFGTISKKYRHYSETFRHCSESEYSLCFRRLFQLPTSKNNQNSLKIRSIHWIFAFQVLILRTWSVKQCGLGRRTHPKINGSKWTIDFYQNNTEKSRWYCSAYSSEYSSAYSSDNIAKRE